MHGNRIILFMVMVILATAGCQKEVALPFTVVDLPTKGDARAFYTTGDSLIVVGGDFEDQGFIALHQTGTEIANLLASGLKRECYSITRHRKRWYVGGDSLLLYRGANLASLPQYYWGQLDWVSDLSNHPLRSMAADSTGVMTVAGSYLAFGALFHSYDNAASWDPIEPENELRCAVIRDGVAWVGGNGILMRSVWGSGQWERLPLENVFLVDLQFENASEGTALSRRGAILLTKNGGESWTELQSRGNRFMEALAVQGELVIAVGERGTFTYQSGREGDWKRVDLGDEYDLHDVTIHENAVYVAGDEGRLFVISLDDLR